jgi:hypothetical protein
MSIDKELESVCSICLNNIDDTAKNIIKTECGHIFHSTCFLQNVAFNGFDCPNCRNVLANKPDSSEQDEDEEDDFDEDEEDDFDEEEEQYILNGSRWLFMRAEGEEIDNDDDDDYGDYIREPRPESLNISINEIAEKMIQRGVTYNQLLALLVLPDSRNASDLAEYSGRKLSELDTMIYDIIYSNVN